jgi:hypothetical protein
MKDLFYSESEKILFWVSGYDILHNQSNVIKITNDLINDAKKLANVIQTDVNNVLTIEVFESSKYKYMRVFFIKDVEKCPENAFMLTIKNGWTMRKWLNN